MNMFPSGNNLKSITLYLLPSRNEIIINFNYQCVNNIHQDI